MGKVKEEENLRSFGKGKQKRQLNRKKRQGYMERILLILLVTNSLTQQFSFLPLHGNKKKKKERRRRKKKRERNQTNTNKKTENSSALLSSHTNSSKSPPPQLLPPLFPPPQEEAQHTPLKQIQKKIKREI